MRLIKSEVLPLHTDDDLVKVRQAVRAWMIEQAFGLVAQTKMVTAASELGRNIVVYGGGGFARLECLDDFYRLGFRVIFEDQGPGIADINQALTDGFTTGKGLGLGLGGAKRLVNDFEIWSEPGYGTRVTITMWK
ncbi:anti-sigma regulatory factor [Methylobacter sp. S3L5C]|uniref:anti-sigma regulatory factor n=1 Tax=Methylobacter sp. S3L5C TaxID=2839024 RepID=UPI001FACABBD|nr:anti-sigma regulatory factor [Methylobacter sp. S3L5C]UOA07886.1 anti-sigma regulatory factor [Methylobacter sp. S3L5C]